MVRQPKVSKQAVARDTFEPALNPAAGLVRDLRQALARIAPRADLAIVITPHYFTKGFSPAATRIICSTRSRPVMASVTGCSTWSRVFISRK